MSLITTYEGFEPKAYLCPAGVWTIGFGTTRIDDKPVTKGMSCTLDEARTWLADDLKVFEAAIERLATVPLTQPEFDALASFVYNVGVSAFSKSTLLKKLNQRDRTGAAAEFGRWTKGGGKVLPGLVVRRAAERTLFLTKPDG